MRLTCAAVHSASSPADSVQGGDELAQYIASGPLLEVCGISASSISSNLAEWKKLGDRLADQLGFNAQCLDEVQRCVVGCDAEPRVSEKKQQTNRSEQLLCWQANSTHVSYRDRILG